MQRPPGATEPLADDITRSSEPVGGARTRLSVLADSTSCLLARGSLHEPAVNGSNDLGEHAIPRPPRGLQELERVVAALHHMQARPIAEALQHRAEELEIAQW